MAEETNLGKTELTSPSRREVVTKAAQVAVTAPAVALLLNAYSKNAFAQATCYGNPSTPGCLALDDEPSRSEDIDTFGFGTNFNPLNQAENQDDRI